MTCAIPSATPAVLEIKSQIIKRIERIVYNTTYYQSISENELNRLPMLEKIKPFNSSNKLLWGLWTAFHRIFKELENQQNIYDFRFQEFLIKEARDCIDIFKLCNQYNLY